jgi:hypothetical protein
MPEGTFGGLRYGRPTLSHKPLSPVWWAPETALLRGARLLSQSPSHPGMVAPLGTTALSSHKLRSTARRGPNEPRNMEDAPVGPIGPTGY